VELRLFATQNAARPAVIPASEMLGTGFSDREDIGKAPWPDPVQIEIECSVKLEC